MKMIEGFVRQWWRYWSMRVAFFWSALVGWLMADPGNMATFVGLFPHEMRPAIGPLLGFAIFTTQLAARGVTQAKLAK